MASPRVLASSSALAKPEVLSGGSLSDAPINSGSLGPAFSACRTRKTVVVTAWTAGSDVPSGTALVVVSPEHAAHSGTTAMTIEIKKDTIDPSTGMPYGFYDDAPTPPEVGEMPSQEFVDWWDNKTKDMNLTKNDIGYMVLKKKGKNG